MGRRLVKEGKLLKCAVIVSAAAAIIAFAAYKVGRDERVSVESLKSTVKDAVKDIKIPEPISADDVNKILADTKRVIKKGRKVSKKLYRDLEKEATKQNRKISTNS